MSTLLSLLAVAITLQNPMSPDVRLPAGWKATYWKAEYGGVGALVKDDGSYIGFPDYFGTGKVAEVTAEMDIRALIVSAQIGGTPIDVALSSKNLLAISYGRPANDPGSYFPIDFWRTVKTSQEVFETMAIALTRVTAMRSRYQPHDVPAPKWTSDLYTFGYRRPIYLPRSGPTADLDGNKQLIIEEASDLPKDTKWSMTQEACDGTLTACQAKDGSLAVAYDGKGRKRVVITCKRPSMAGMVVAILNATTAKSIDQSSG